MNVGNLSVALYVATTDVSVATDVAVTTDVAVATDVAEAADNRSINPFAAGPIQSVRN